MNESIGPVSRSGLGEESGAPAAGFDGIELAFHHVGVACNDLDAEAKPLMLLGYHAEGEDFVDPVQGVRGRFLNGQSPRLELLAALPGHAVLDPWLKSKARFYHIAYETPSLDSALTALVERRAKVVVRPVASVAFEGRRIAFLMLPTMIMIELIGK